MDLDFDPFGLRARVANSALSKQHTLGADIYSGLFERIFFQSEVYKIWSRGDRAWQLHCYGSPGCGKTTLAAIAVQRLRGPVPGEILAPVVSVFIENDVSQDAAAFLEDFLACIHHQIPSAGLESDGHLEDYERAYKTGESTFKRIHLLRVALHSRLDDNDHTFLVFDGYDRLSEGLQVLLDHELADLQVHSLRVLQTRRVPAFELPLEMNCDGYRDGEDCEEEDLKLYWLCKKCIKDPMDCWTICYKCKNQRVKCPIHGAAYLYETYDHVDINISNPDDIADYVAWDLQRVYGDDGAYHMQQNRNLDSDMTNKSDRAHTNNTMTSDTKILSTSKRRLKAIIDISKIGNITLVKLYLDNIHKHQSLEVVEKVGDRHARNLIAFFDAGIERIKQQPKHQSDVALMAIAAAAEEERGVPLAQLEEQMRDALSRQPHIVEAPPRSLEDILRYANGFIATTYSEDRRVSTYNLLFTLYVRENYNESLFWAKNELNIRRVSRSSTFQHQFTSPPLVASPPTTDIDIETPNAESKRPIHESPLRNFEETVEVHGFPFPPRKISSVRPKSPKDSSGPGISMFGRASRVSTMLPSTTRKTGFRNVSFDKQEVPTLGEREKPRRTPSTKEPSSRLCAFCETTVLGSGELSGRYQRQYSHLQVPVAKSCVFCSALYKDFLEMSRPDREKLNEAEPPIFWWSIRSTAKSRESNNSVVVSFRSSQQSTKYDITFRQNSSTPNLPSFSKVSNLPARPATYRFHLVPEHKMGHIPTDYELSPTTDISSKSGNQVKIWIDECSRNHPNCVRKAETIWVPTRLLDLQFGDLNSVRLVITAIEHTTGPYITLSHCWGLPTPDNSFLTTQGEKVLEYTIKGIKIADLSVNFQQAIGIARFMGIRYMWIDSLCIIQGPQSDFLTEGQLMHKVYRYSYCNLAAADAVDSRGGFFRSRNPADILPGRYQGDGSSAMFGTTTWRIMPEDLWEVELLNSSIYTRGWVFQERMLTPRILHFARNQIFWDCATISACETIPNGLPFPLDDAASTDRHWRGRLQESTSLTHTPLSGANDDSLENFWSSSVLRYTQCNLTSQSDKSVAIWSIAKLVRDAVSDQYGAGLWSDGLDAQLGWKVVNAKNCKRSPDLQWMQPSWSWTSIQGAVSLAERSAVRQHYQIKGHVGEVIAFKIKGSSRTRIHSDSFQEDLEIGWNAWQKKARIQSMPQQRMRSDMIGERSQSMPTGQQTAKKPVVSKNANAQVWSRDLEPELETKSIAMHAHLGLGTLHNETGTGIFTLNVTPATETTPPITLIAYPDTDHENDTTLSPDTFHFLVLTATSQTAPTTNALGLTFEYDSDNDPEPTHTYSGTGLLLLRCDEYLRRSTFHSNLKFAEKALEVRLATGGGDAWATKKMIEEIEALTGLVGQCEQYEGTAEEGKHFRRVGVVEFLGWSEEVYRDVMGRGREKIWVD